MMSCITGNVTSRMSAPASDFNPRRRYETYARYALECIDSLLFVADEIKEGKYDRVKKELKEIADGPNPDDIGG